MFIILSGWISSYQTTCLSLFFAFLFWATIAWSFIDIKMHERMCVKQCYFHPTSFIAKLLSSRILVTIVFMLTALAMSYSSLVAILDFGTLQWLYIVIHLLLLIMLYSFLKNIFRNIVKEKYLKIMAREWSIRIAALFLLGWIVYLSFNGKTPSYLQPTLQETLAAATNSIQSHCHYIDQVLRFNKETEALSWWLMSKESRLLKSEPLHLLAWLIFLLFNALAVLGINRWISQIIYLLDTHIINKTKEVPHAR